LPVQFVIDATQRFPISPYIYGVNGYETAPNATTPEWPNGLTISRFGGNRLTAYNWENNASNAGRDYKFQNDDFLGGGSVPGEAARARVAAAAAKGAGMIVTVPMIGHVSRDIDHTSVGSDAASIQSRLAARFVPSYARKNAPFAETPDVDDRAVYQDEFVHWLSRRFPDATSSGTTPLFFALDNEPDIWGSTHEEIMPNVNGKIATLTYDDLINLTVAYSAAIKDADPSAVVFGPGTATWTGATTLGRWPDADPRYGRRTFLDVYLDRLREEEIRNGRRLVDVLDIHWYPAAGAAGQEIVDDAAPQTAEMIWARLQSPRSLWDSTYDEQSWVSKVQKGPIRLLPLLKEKISAHYPGTKLAITEYYYGRGGDISGGIAQADVLGIFGREGVFAATLWPTANPDAVPYGGSAERAYQYIIGAFRMFRDYDGRGGKFGAAGLAARTSAPAGSSVYASTDDNAATRVVIVAINKLSRSRAAVIEFSGSFAWRNSEVYTLTETSSEPKVGAALSLADSATLRFTMPPLSVSTIVLRR
jgi:hypothetical protein